MQLDNKKKDSQEGLDVSRGQRAECRWCASLCVAVKGAKRQIFGRGQCCTVEGSECCERAVS